MPVPEPVPATDGRHFAGGLVVMTYGDRDQGQPRRDAARRRGPVPGSVGAARRPHQMRRHGDPSPGNIRMTADRVALVDWDESHVGVPGLDLALPRNAADLGDDAHDIAAQGRAAWEAAVCWDLRNSP